MKKFSLLLLVASAFLLQFCGTKAGPGMLSGYERTIIRKSDSVMYVFSVFDRQDSLVLRTKCVDFSDEELHSEDFKMLAAKMMATVLAPQQGGVGIAAPQVGITHRVIIVCRTDKEGEPYEVYPNARIDSLWGEVRPGPEGCLSIPSYRGMVPRYSNILLSYKDAETLDTVKDTVSGFAAVIFQHECDHLDGILYTDRADTVSFSRKRADERAPYAAAGLYDKPSFIK